ncbi:MAG TPA: hypothetical protein VHV47_06850, partial [Opitutaceae bacterium]|nr:hypothetical protein [Opitutaceae bacterium]
TPPLSYHAGDDISRHLQFAPLDPDAKVDVHAGQVQLLERSRCFRSSSHLTCITCHDVHQPQRDAASFSSKCMTCHQVRDCGRFPQLGQAIAARCIECHMPLQETAKIISSVDGSKVAPQVRNHRIAIYPDHVN